MEYELLEHMQYFSGSFSLKSEYLKDWIGRLDCYLALNRTVGSFFGWFFPNLLLSIGNFEPSGRALIDTTTLEDKRKAIICSWGENQEEYDSGVIRNKDFLCVIGMFVLYTSNYD